MSDLVSRPRVLDGKIRDGERAPSLPGELVHDCFVMGAELASARQQIEALTTENAALRAKLEQYEEAEVVGWHWFGRDQISTWPIFTIGPGRPYRAPKTAVPLIRKPEV